MRAMTASLRTRDPHLAERALVDKLRAIPKGEVAEVARKAGLPLNHVLRLKRGMNTDVRISTYAKLAIALDPAGNDPDTLVLEDEAAIEDALTAPPVVPNGFMTVPRRHAQIGAGPGFVDELDEPKNYAFTEDWLKRMGFSNPSKDPGRLGVFKVSASYGSSMEPTIRPGAVLLADLGQSGEGHRRAHDGRIYVVREEGGGLQVKRVRQQKKTEELIVWGDNAREGPPESWPLKGRDVRAVLVGEVRWVGQEVP